MNRYHINNKGLVDECKAESPETCKCDTLEHFDTFKEAQDYADKKLKEEVEEERRQEKLKK